MALLVYLFIPHAVLFVLVGIAFGWWIAALFVLGVTAILASRLALRRTRALRWVLWGSDEYDPLDYAQWTRFYGPPSFVRSLWMSVPMAAAFAATILGASFILAAVVGIAAGVGGVLVGAERWRRAEDARREAELG